MFSFATIIFLIYAASAVLARPCMYVLYIGFAAGLLFLDTLKRLPVLCVFFVWFVLEGLEMDGPAAGGDGGDVDAFELGGDGVDMGGGMDGMDDFGGGGFEADLNLNDDGAPDMQVGRGGSVFCHMFQPLGRFQLAL